MELIYYAPYHIQMQYNYDDLLSAEEMRKVCPIPKQYCTTYMS